MFTLALVLTLLLTLSALTLIRWSAMTKAVNPTA
jgi:hypothetical protein